MKNDVRAMEYCMTKVLFMYAKLAKKAFTLSL